MKTDNVRWQPQWRQAEPLAVGDVVEYDGRKHRVISADSKGAELIDICHLAKKKSDED